LAADIINRLQNAKIFTKFDVCWGYHNVRIRRDDEWKAAFVTNQGLFEPKVMFFGLTNSPATFQSLMNSIFADLITQNKVAVYLDDILIWSSTLKEHHKIVHKVLYCLQMHDLYLHSEKCEFEQAKVDYLGLVISHGKVSMDPVKIEAIVNWPTPESLKEVQSVAVAPYFLLFSVFFSPALIATAPHTWLSHGCHAEATRSSCSAHSASFASRITRYLVTCLLWMLVHAQHLSHQSHVTRWSVRSVFSINTCPCCFS
jgi:hypothetical protein